MIKEKRAPDCKSFKNIQEALGDKLLLAKITFLENLANSLQTFLLEFQSDKPLIPFLFNDLLLICRHILSKFVKEHVLKKADLTKLDLNYAENMIALKDIKLDSSTKHALRKSKGVSSLKVIQFKNECRKCLKALF